MTVSHRLLQARHELQAYFAEQAERIGLDTHPETDIRVLDISELLYYEEHGPRKVRIFLDEESNLEFDWYIKDGDVDKFPATVLAIFVNGQFLDLPRLWNIYFAWMIRQESVKVISEHLMLKR